MSDDRATTLAKTENFQKARDFWNKKNGTGQENQVHHHDECANRGEDDGRDDRQHFVERKEGGVLAKYKQLTMANFTVLQMLGEGGGNLVHLVRFEGSDDFFALKERYRPINGCKAAIRERLQQDASAELKFLRKARNKWVVELFATFQDAGNIYMVMEVLQGGDLASHLTRKKKFSIVETQFYMAELCEALDAVHRCGFVHRDVRPTNILLTSAGHLKLLSSCSCKEDPSAALDAQAAADADLTATTKQESFELATARTMLTDCVGTPEYMAPEVVGCCEDEHYGIEADFWSLGIITFECLVGHVPFHGGLASDSEATQVTKELGYLIDKMTGRGLLKTVSAEFISGTLHPNRFQRFSAQRMRKDPFFSGIDFENIHTAEPPIVPEVKRPSAGANKDLKTPPFPTLLTKAASSSPKNPSST